jgi:choice-of-anchor B domain-containing protein
MSRSVLVGLVAVCASGLFNPRAVEAQFASQNVSLHSQINLATFGASSGNDCWGYTSPSGREYALMSVRNKLAFVEITNPAVPDWFASIPHPDSTWGDVKVHGAVAYAVTETNGTGIQVIDMSNIDNRVVTLVRTIPLPDTNHNIAVDTISGYLYTCGSNGGSATTVIFDLSDPTDPLEVGTWSGAYEHDAQIITYRSGPYAGRQIMFGASEGRGLDVIDVTLKSNTFLVSRTPYPNVAYCHQLWTEDLQYLYINDELDSITRTTVFDISDINNPVMVGEVSSGTGAIDHNNYVRNGFLYEANYHSGLRIFNTNCDPVQPLQIGWFDTYPADDGNGFDGAWSCYPFFPSGTVIVSDFDRGLFVLDVSQALTAETLLFDYANGQATLIHPAGGTTMRVEALGVCGSAPQPGTGLLHYDLGTGFVSVPMNVVSGNLYDAVFPAAPCGWEVSYYTSAVTTNGTTVTDPSSAPASVYTATASAGINVAFGDDFQADLGWTAVNLGASSGDWERGVPVNDPGWAYDPVSDSDGSGSCLLTQNQLGNTDVDGNGGSVRVTSPSFGIPAGQLRIGYDYFLRLTNTAGGVDRLLVEIGENDGAGPWTTVAVHDTDGGLSWRHHDITMADLDAAGVTITSAMRMRFTANDSDPQSIVEAGVDAFSVGAVACPIRSADTDLDNDVDLKDAAFFARCFTGDGGCACLPAVYELAGKPECAAADLDYDGDVDLIDWGEFEAQFVGP